MKFALAIILGATSAARLSAAPQSACQKFGAKNGVDCESSLLQFADGFVGDEDLGEDIIMRGSPYHFIQGKALA